MKNLTLTKLGAILFFCALFLGTFCACEKSELEMIDAATKDKDAEIFIKPDNLRADPKLPAIRITPTAP